VGGEAYASGDDPSGEATYGLATLLRSHVEVRGAAMEFRFPAKGGIERAQRIVDRETATVLKALLRRDSDDPELLAYRAGRQWRDVRSDDINAYLSEVAGGEFTAKDFRTWHATVLMAVALAVSTPVAGSRTARQRAISRAYREVSEYLGNTPAVCRSSYVDPRVVDLYCDGATVARALEHLGADVDGGQLATQGPIERAVLQMLRQAA
jgi:DNA topoisomerase I